MIDREQVRNVAAMAHLRFDESQMCDITAQLDKMAAFAHVISDIADTLPEMEDDTPTSDRPSVRESAGADPDFSSGGFICVDGRTVR